MKFESAYSFENHLCLFVKLVLVNMTIFIYLFLLREENHKLEFLKYFSSSLHSLKEYVGFYCAPPADFTGDLIKSQELYATCRVEAEVVILLSF